RTASSRPKIQSRIRDHSCSRSESPISHIVGGHSPTKRARLSALPRCVWSTVLARIHRPRQRPIVPNEARYRWVLRTPARCSSPITMCVSVFVDSCDHRQAGYSTVGTRIAPASPLGGGTDVATVASAPGARREHTVALGHRTRHLALSVGDNAPAPERIRGGRVGPSTPDTT